MINEQQITTAQVKDLDPNAEQEGGGIPFPDQKRLGIIQTRGLGDILVALPIARHYYDQGWEVVWPVCSPFFSSLVHSVPWVRWLTVDADHEGLYFFDEPHTLLQQAECTGMLILYQSLSSHPHLSQKPFFQIQKFDEFKYTMAQVPFHKKWTLSRCIERQADREQELYDRVVKQPQYYVTHLKGSDYQAKPDLGHLPAEWQRIDIDENATDSIFDWLKILEGCQALIALDSVIANMVDQLDMDIDKYWIPRSHIHLTPVLGSVWTILPPPPDSMAASEIFRVATGQAAPDQ